MGKHNILISKALVTVEGEYVPLRYLNLQDESIKLYKNSVVAIIEKCNDIGNDVESVISQVSTNTENASQLPDHLEQILHRVHESVTQEQ